MSDEDGWNEDRSYGGQTERLKAVAEAVNRTLVYTVSDPEITRMRDRGHWPMRDDRRLGRRAYVCGHCGSRMTWRSGGGWEGTLASVTSRCFPKPGDPISRREQELLDLDEEMGWGETRSAIEVANWATRATASMHRSLARGGR